jgi:hypothetical protein
LGIEEMEGPKKGGKDFSFFLAKEEGKVELGRLVI